jgi:UDP-N-acetylglucosamine transferase subunit ALG13
LDPDLILSDNRYGCRHKSCFSILVTHQLHFPGLPVWARTAPEWWVNETAVKFDEVWIPDYPGKIGLSGNLSESRKKINKRYIGPLTRLKVSRHPKKWDWIALISGVEPARSKFTEKILEIFAQLPGARLLIEGRPGEIREIITNGVHVLNYANATTLSRILSSADIVVARAGYSTIMDLASFQLKSILIPTAGQPEQEYLAEWLDNHRWCHVFSEDQLSAEGMLTALRYPRVMPRLAAGEDLLEQAVGRL